MRRLLSSVSARLLDFGLRVSETLIRRCSADGRRVYFDASRYAWSVELESKWREIRQELEAVLECREEIPPFQEVSEEQRAITNDDRWRAFVMYVFGTPIRVNCARCPRTTDMLSRVPGLQNAMFSILAPGKDIPEHRGPYNGLLRYQLALKVPAGPGNCAIWVAGERREWTEGVAIVFDDSFPHRVRNDTAQERVVLFADFFRPLPWWLDLLNRGMVAMIRRTPLARRPIDQLVGGTLR